MRVVVLHSQDDPLCEDGLPELLVRCMSVVRTDRPTMAEVVRELQGMVRG